jgi:uncharacterized membrane protein YheB (UPF0754 family)
MLIKENKKDFSDIKKKKKNIENIKKDFRELFGKDIDKAGKSIEELLKKLTNDKNTSDIKTKKMNILNELKEKFGFDDSKQIQKAFNIIKANWKEEEKRVNEQAKKRFKEKLNKNEIKFKIKIMVKKVYDRNYNEIMEIPYIKK